MTDNEWDEREETVRFEKWRPTHVAEMALTFVLIAVVGFPVVIVTESPMAGAATGALVVTLVQEALWRYRGYPELTPSRRLIDAVR